MGSSKIMTEYNNSDDYRGMEFMTNYDMVYHHNSSTLTVQGKESLMNAPLNSVLAAQSSSQMTVDESWMKRIWEWADEFEIPEEDIPRNRDGLLAIERLSFVMNYWENERCECVKYKILSKIKYIPDEVTYITNLVAFEIIGLRLNYLPNNLGRLVNLTTLKLHNNEFRTLPESIGQLTNLTELKINNNELEELPESIGQLTNLTKLHIDYNYLRELPESIGQLANLIELKINSNELEELPESIGDLTNLVELHVSDNQLRKLPESIGQLTHLTELKVNNNDIS